MSIPPYNSRSKQLLGFFVEIKHKKKTAIIKLIQNFKYNLFTYLESKIVVVHKIDANKQTHLQYTSYCDVFLKVKKKSFAYIKCQGMCVLSGYIYYARAVIKII